MNKVVLIGRLTKDAELRMSGETAVTRFTVAVDRRGQDAGADFISCVAFKRTAEFVEKYFSKGSKIVIAGHIQTGSYKNKDGQTVYTTDVIADEVEFGESKQQTPPPSTDNGFMNIPDGLVEDLPFN